MLIRDCPNDFDCVSTLSEIIIKPNQKYDTNCIIAEILIERKCDLFHFNKIKLVVDNKIIDNSCIKKIQLIVDKNIVISNNLKIFNVYFPLIASMYQQCKLRIFIDTQFLTQPFIDNIILTYEQIYLKTSLQFLLCNKTYELFEGIEIENGFIKVKAEVKTIKINNYQTDVIDNLNIIKNTNNVLLTSSLEMLIRDCPNYFDGVSTLSEIIIKPNYKITDDNISTSILIKKDCDLFRFNKIQLMHNNNKITNDNLLIKKIQLVSDEQVIIDDLRTFNRYFPIVACICDCEFKIFINKGCDNTVNNIKLTYEKIVINCPLRTSLIEGNYELFKEMQVKNGFIIKNAIVEADIKIKNYQTDVINKLIIHKNKEPQNDILGLILLMQHKNDFDCVDTQNTIIKKPIFSMINDDIIGIIKISSPSDILRFNEIQIINNNNKIIDNSYIKKIQLVSNGKVIIDNIKLLCSIYIHNKSITTLINIICFCYFFSS